MLTKISTPVEEKRIKKAGGPNRRKENNNKKKQKQRKRPVINGKPKDGRNKCNHISNTIKILTLSMKNKDVPKLDIF